MKNCNFSPGLYGALRHSRYLLLAILFTLGSCRKDFISDVAVSENDAAGSIRYQSTSRSSDLESEVVRYTQWMITNMVPLVKDKAVYEDIRSGNYSTARVQSKLNALGFSGYSDFAADLGNRVNTIQTAINAGNLGNEKITRLLEQNLLFFDFSILSDDVPQALNGGDPNLPCYKQMVHEIRFLIAEVAIILAMDGPEPAAREATLGVWRARVNYMDCIWENYPLGGG